MATLMSRALRAVLVVLMLSSTVSCSGDAARRGATATIVSAGLIGNGIVRANRDIYVAATDALRVRVQGADYAREVVPLDRAFDARSHAVQALSADLYGAAALVDATRGTDAGLASYAAVARLMLDAIQANIVVLRDGSILPAVPIPASVETLLATLQGLAGGVR